MASGYYLTKDDVAWLRRMRKTLSGISGDGVINSGDNIRITQKRAPRAVQDSPTSPVGVFILTGTATRAGYYTMKAMQFATTLPEATSAGNFTDAQIGAGAGPTVYGINMREAAATSGTHALDVSGASEPMQVIGFLCGSNPSDGKPCYEFDLCQ